MVRSARFHLARGGHAWALAQGRAIEPETDFCDVPAGHPRRRIEGAAKEQLGKAHTSQQILLVPAWRVSAGMPAATILAEQTILAVDDRWAVGVRALACRCELNKLAIHRASPKKPAILRHHEVWLLSLCNTHPLIDNWLV
jgi:hypothetical protein